MPKGDIIGNQLCWYGNLCYVIKDVSDPKQKLLTRYKTREKIFGDQNVGKKVAQRAMVDWCKICGCLLYTSPSPRD